MIYIKGGQSVQLPGELVSTTAENVRYQSKGAIVSDTHPYWKAFSDGFVEGFSFPFSALFGMAGCSNNFPLPATNDGAPCDTSADAGAHDASSDVEAADVPVDVTATQDGTEDTTDVCQDFCEADVIEDAADIDLPDAVTEDVAPDVEDTVEDVAADIPEDVTLSDAAEDVALPDAVTEDAAADVDDSGICQYFCDAGIADTTDAQDVTLPQDATPVTDTSEPPVGVPSKMCTGPAGTETLFAPPNSVAVACTNSAINALILGGNSCVAECGFYDNNVILSTAPNAPVPFSTALFAPPEVTKQSYTVTLALHAPMFANGKTPALPGFMESSFVFVFDQMLYDMVGAITWNSVDKDSNGNVKGKLQIQYQPKNFFLNFPEFLDMTYTDTVGNNTSYRYPCDQLVDNQGTPNPIINCAEVK